MSRVLDWIENIGDAIILLLLSLGVAFPKKPTTVTEIFEQLQLPEEIINVYNKIIEVLSQSQSIDELYKIPNEINLYPPLLTYISSVFSGIDKSMTTPQSTFYTNVFSGITLSLAILPSSTYEANAFSGTSLSLDTPSIAYEIEITT